MTLQKLLRKMKEEGIVYYAVVESWLESYNYKSINRIIDNETFGRLSGFIWGLLIAGYITPEERDCLIDEILSY